MAIRAFLCSFVIATGFAASASGADFLAKLDRVQASVDSGRIVEAYRLNGELQVALTIELKNPRVMPDMRNIPTVANGIIAVRAALAENNVLAAYEREMVLSMALHQAKAALTPADRLQQLEQDLTQDRSREGRLGEIGYAALEVGDLVKAESYGRELLAASANPKPMPHGDSIYHSNQILGIVAIRRNDVNEAKLRLAASGATPGSPSLNSFGPTFLLAKELCAKGEKDSVLQFLEACGKFWKMDRGKLAEWSAIIRGGGVPRFESY